MTDKILSAPKLLENKEVCLKNARIEVSEDRQAAIARLMKRRLIGWFPFRRKPTHEEAVQLTSTLFPYADQTLLDLHCSQRDLEDLERVFRCAEIAMRDEMRPEEPHVVVDWRDYQLLRRFGAGH